MDLKLGHHATDGIEVIDVQGEIDIYTAPRLRELLIDLVSKGSYQLVVNLDKVGFLDSTGLGVLVGGLKRVRAHDGSLNLVCTQQRILKILKITGLTEVFGIYLSGGPGHRGREGPPVRNTPPGPRRTTSGSRSPQREGNRRRSPGDRFMGLLHRSRRLQRSMKRGCPCWQSAEGAVSQVLTCETGDDRAKRRALSRSERPVAVTHVNGHWNLPTGGHQGLLGYGQDDHAASLRTGARAARDPPFGAANCA